MPARTDARPPLALDGPPAGPFAGHGRSTAPFVSARIPPGALPRRFGEVGAVASGRQGWRS
jgi:hypothetical protein